MQRELLQDVLQCHEKNDDPGGKRQNGQWNAVLAEERFAEEGSQQDGETRKRLARTATWRLNAASAPFVIFAKGPMILNGPSIRNRNVKICATGKFLSGSACGVTSMADAIPATNRQPKPTITLWTKGACRRRYGLLAFLHKIDNIRRLLCHRSQVGGEGSSIRSGVSL